MMLMLILMILIPMLGVWMYRFAGRNLGRNDAPARENARWSRSPTRPGDSLTVHPTGEPSAWTALDDLQLRRLLDEPPP
jgi:hypothetical protein